MTIRTIAPGARMSQAVIHNGTVYLAGQVAGEASADAAGQTRDILERIDALLEEAGTDRSHALSATIWLTSMDDFAAMNEVWDAWVAPGHPPARACVEAQLARAELRVEIMLIAALPEA